MNFRNVMDLIETASLEEEKLPGKLERVEQGFGLETLYGQGFALAGGMRSGSSPPRLLRRGYAIYDTDAIREGVPQEQANVGMIHIFTDANNDVRGIIDIKLNPKQRKAGIGSAVVKSLAETCPTDLSLFDIRQKAVGFWTKMGCKFFSPSGKPVDKPREYKGMLMGVMSKPDSSGDVRNLPGFPGWGQSVL